jgi:hypothetical protein
VPRQPARCRRRRRLRLSHDYDGYTDGRASRLGFDIHSGSSCGRRVDEEQSRQPGGRLMEGGWGGLVPRARNVLVCEYLGKVEVDPPTGSGWPVQAVGADAAAARATGTPNPVKVLHCSTRSPTPPHPASAPHLTSTCVGPPAVRDCQCPSSASGRAGRFELLFAAAGYEYGYLVTCYSSIP